MEEVGGECFFLPFFSSSSSPALSASSNSNGHFSLSLFSSLSHLFQEIPVARHTTAHADVITEREPAKGRGDAHEERVARELSSRRPFDAAVGGVCIAPRRREDWWGHFDLIRVARGLARER